jgi:hypothetical protein
MAHLFLVDSGMLEQIILANETSTTSSSFAIGLIAKIEFRRTDTVHRSLVSN